MKLEMDKPAYPTAALTFDREAIVLLRFTLGKDCVIRDSAVIGTIVGRPDGQTWLFKQEWNESFEREALKVAQKAKLLAPTCRLESGARIEQAFLFKTENNPGFKLAQIKVMSIKTFLSLFEFDKSKDLLPIEVETGCPALISITPRSPLRINTVVKISEQSVPLDAKFKFFLEELELKDQFKMSFFLKSLLVEFPCTSLTP
jgi:hypothetical protein